MAKDAADAVPQNRVVVSGSRYLFDDSVIYN
jgi:hypothetical protein